jgi:hypothetical protein
MPCTRPMNAAQRVSVFGGVGAWVDVYDWSPSIATRPAFDLQDVDALAAKGVEVIYIQSTRPVRPEAILDKELFQAIIDRAHSHGMRLVSWYLPTHNDLKTDWVRLVLPMWLGADGIVWDIEDTTSLKDVPERNRRLVQVANAMRRNYPNLPMAAATLPNVVTDVLNLNYWPNFPWTELRDTFDVWMPMDYWTNRAAGSEYRDAERYTSENISRLRAKLGKPDAVVSPVGGIADKVTQEDLAGFIRASKAAGAIGVSLYDHATSQMSFYDDLATFRTP